MKTVDVIIERGSDGTFDANMETYSDLEFGLLGQGKTVEEAKADLMNSYNKRNICRARKRSGGSEV